MSNSFIKISTFSIIIFTTYHFFKYLKTKSRTNIVKNTEEQKNDNFLTLYPISQDEIQESINNITDKDYTSYINKILNFDTPKGIIYMYYNHNENNFQYWSDKIFSYLELEVIVRKYCIEYNCKELYIDRKYELKIKREQIEKNLKFLEEQKKKQETENKKSVFATLKNYNKGIKNNIKDKVNNNDINKILIDNTLKFLKVGNINDYNIYKDIKNTKKINKKVNVSYNNFKNK
jgi:hypothetical protein